MRLPDWEQRLVGYLTSVRDKPFRYGEHDCILHACAAAAAMTGEDKAANFRGRYSDREGAAAILRERGKGTLIRTLNANFPRRPAAMARRGDIVWFAGSAGVGMGSVGLFVGEERLANKAGMVMREGLVQIPRALLSKAWAV